MKRVNLYPHQIQALKTLKNQSRVALYWDMGLGKTFGGSEKLNEFNNAISVIVCQKSKIEDWLNHFETYYPDYEIFNLTSSKIMNNFLEAYSNINDKKIIGIINYDLIFRRDCLLELSDFTLLLDESSLIQNEQAKRSKFILKMKPKNVILLSGTPTGGKYEKLWSQMKLLGWKISKSMYWNQYVETKIIDDCGFPLKVVTGYKNVERLKTKMREYGAHFLKSDEVFQLPEQVFNTLIIPTTKEYRKFKKTSVVQIDDVELAGETILTQMLYERQLCGQYNKDKINAFRDILEGTNDRLIVFYNFTAEVQKLIDVAESLDRPYSIISGELKDLTAYENELNSITFIQYQAGAMGLNLQKANKIIYFTLPLSSELFEQSKKRTHRIGQSRTCFYYYLICKNSIEMKIYDALQKRKDYTERLFDNHG